MIWQLFLIPGAIAILSIAAAIYYRYWYSTATIIIGMSLGGILAVVPLQRSMDRYLEETGFDGGNAGIFFVCTIPTFPIAGLALGLLVGMPLDNRFGSPRRMPPQNSSVDY